MKDLIKADLWSFWGVADALCITTNGFVKTNSECVMGRGCALEAVQRFPGVAFNLGRSIRSNGNRVQIIPEITVPLGVPTALVAFPTKVDTYTPADLLDVQDKVLQWNWNKVKPGQRVPGWMCKSSIPLITDSLVQLVLLADKEKWTNIVLPIPGVGNGGLDMASMVEFCAGVLDDRFQMVMK